LEYDEEAKEVFLQVFVDEKENNFLEYLKHYLRSLFKETEQALQITLLIDHLSSETKSD